MDKILESLAELIKPRSVYTLLFYVTFCFLILNAGEAPDELNTIVSTMLGFWFGNKAAVTKKELAEK